MSDTALIVRIILYRSRRKYRRGFAPRDQIGGSMTFRWLHLLTSTECKCAAERQIQLEE